MQRNRAPCLPRKNTPSTAALTQRSATHNSGALNHDKHSKHNNNNSTDNTNHNDDIGSAQVRACDDRA